MRVSSFILIFACIQITMAYLNMALNFLTKTQEVGLVFGAMLTVFVALPLLYVEMRFNLK